MANTELADIRHELKNVMTALRSGCLLLERAGSEEERRDVLQEMRVEIERGSAAIGRLRDVGATLDGPAR